MDSKPPGTTLIEAEVPVWSTGPVAGPVDTAWRNYADKVLCPRLPAAEREAQRTAFYAGAGAAFDEVLAGMEAGDATPAEVRRRMAALVRELDAFGRACAAGGGG